MKKHSVTMVFVCPGCGKEVKPSTTVLISDPMYQVMKQSGEVVLGSDIHCIGVCKKNN